MNQIKVGETFTRTYTSDLSSEFLQSSHDLIEEAKVLDWRFTRSKLVTSCVTAFLAIEAYINRVFYDSFSPNSKTKLNILPQIPEAIQHHVKASWSRLSIKDKCIVIVPLVSTKSLEINESPFNLFIEFIKFRNRLVHAKSWETEEMIYVTHSNLDENMQGSWGGKTLSKRSLEPYESYPLTKFSNDIMQLSIHDAEKALEISILIILEIRSMIPGSYTEPVMNFRIPKNNISCTSLNGVLNLIARHYSI